MLASPAGQFRPGRLIAVFFAIVALLYVLVALTPGSRTPKLGIDLQGGTQITITARSATNASPTADQMAQSRTIIENRVNGQGVSGAQVQIEGSDQITVSVPGQTKDLGELTRSAALNIREQLDLAFDVSSVMDTSAASSAAASSGSGSAAASVPATTIAAIGDTETPTTPVSGSSAPTTVGRSDSAAPSKASAAAGTVATGSGPVIQNPPSAALATSGNGLRKAAAATVPAGPAAASAGTKSAAAGTTRSSAVSSAVSTKDSAAASGSALAGSAAGTGVTGSGAAAASGSAAASGAGSSAPVATWPIAGSDPSNPNQPAGADAAAWTTWETAAKAAVEGYSVKCSDIAKTEGLDDPNKPLLACSRDPQTINTAGTAKASQVYLLDKTLIPGNQVSQAAGIFDSTKSQWVINVSFNSAGFTTWSNYTTNNVGKSTAFTLDGQVLSSPSISQAITTPVTEVTGSFTQAEASSLANALNFGALPLHFEPGQSTSISASLGSQTLQAGLIAGGIGLLLVVIYCLIYYRLLGVITVLSLALSASLVYAIMTLLGRWIGLSLDIAGIAGLIVAIGITADSFVIYFERLKDEVREGRSFRSAVPRGWERARRTILSADAVSFLSAVVLYLIATGDVKGFAFTLGLSTVLDLVVVFLVTHPLLALASGSRVFQSARFSGLGAVAKAGAEHRTATARLQLKEA